MVCASWELALFGTARDGAGRIPTPLGPRPGKQRRLAAHRREGRDRDGGGDTRAAVGTDAVAAIDAAVGQQLGKRVIGEERALIAQNGGAGNVFGAGDVT